MAKTASMLPLLISIVLKPGIHVLMNILTSNADVSVTHNVRLIR